MPAAAVIPAPIAYIKVAAVKKLVVGFLAWKHFAGRGLACQCLMFWPSFQSPSRLFFIEWSCGVGSFTLKKLECFKQALCYEYISME